MMKVAFACVLTAVCAHDTCPSSDPTCSAAEEAALLQHAATRHVQQQPPPPPPTPPSSNHRRRSPPFVTGTPLGTCDDGKCGQDIVDKLSSAWLLDQSQPFLVGMGQSIFDLTMKDIKHNKNGDFEASFTAGDTNGESAKSLSTDFGINASYGAFTGTLQSAVHAATSSQFASFFSKTWEKFVDTEYIANPLDVWTVLTPEAQTILKNRTVEEIYATLGDFFAKRVSMGGTVAHSIMTSMYENEDEASLDAAASAAYGAGFVSGSVKGSFSGKKNISSGGHSFTLISSAHGGEAQIWFHELKDDCSNWADVKKKWADTFTDENMIPVHFTLQPMWVLLEHIDSAKSQQLKTYMLQQWKDIVHDLPYGPRTAEWTEVGAGQCDVSPGGQILPAYANTLQDCEQACERHTEDECGYIMYTPAVNPLCYMFSKSAQCKTTTPIPDYPNSKTYERPSAGR